MKYPLKAAGALYLLSKPSSALFDTARIFLVALLFGAFFLFAAPYYFPGGANGFTDYAYSLAHGGIQSPANAQRDVGYPLLLWLSGYPYTGSFIGITIIQALMALFMPIIVYWTIRPTFPRTAYLVGLASVLSLAPFYFMKMIHHDQTYIFFSIASACLLSRLVETNKISYLYPLTLSMVMLSFTRPAGNLLFPILLAITFMINRGAIRHYAISIALFIAFTAVYQYHRHEIFDMAHRSSMPSYTGMQIFYNLYMNSREYGITLSPELGPNLKRITSDVTQAVSPNLRDSKVIAQHLSGNPITTPMETAFAEKYFYPYTADEFAKQLYALPNYEYYQLMCDIEGIGINDSLFLNASLEIARAYPLYVIRYSMRNFGKLLWEPGFGHTRYNVVPFWRERIEYPIDGGGINQTGLPARGVRELMVDRLAAQPEYLRSFYDMVRNQWLKTVRLVSVITFFLMLTAWISALVAGLNSIMPSSFLARTADILESARTWRTVAIISALFLYNVVVTSLFVEPNYHYHHMLVLFRVILSGFGAAIAVGCVTRFVGTVMGWRGASPMPAGLSTTFASAEPALRGSRLLETAVIGGLCALTITMFVWWAWDLTRHAV